MAMVRILFLLGTAFFAFAEVDAAPKRYDQRQDGDFNLQAKLDNFLLVGIYSGSSVSSDKLSDLAWQFIESAVTRSKGQELIKSSEAVRQEEPYSVEIVQIDENRPDKENSVRKVDEGDTGTSNVLDQQPTPVSDGQIERIARNVKNFDFPKSREVPTVSGYFVNLRKAFGPKKGGSDRARNVVGNVWNSDDEPGRLGTSLKKQLARRGEQDVALPSSNVAEKNDVSPFAVEKQQELKLLGESIENCGPGRRRDASGVCQFDGLADSL